MSDSQSEKMMGVAKETVGKATGKDDMQAEGEQQQKKAQKEDEAQRLEEQAEAKKREAAGHEGEQRKREG